MNYANSLLDKFISYIDDVNKKCESQLIISSFVYDSQLESALIYNGEKYKPVSQKTIKSNLVFVGGKLAVIRITENEQINLDDYNCCDVVHIYVEFSGNLLKLSSSKEVRLKLTIDKECENFRLKTVEDYQIDELTYHGKANIYEGLTKQIKLKKTVSKVDLRYFDADCLESAPFDTLTTYSGNNNWKKYPNIRTVILTVYDDVSHEDLNFDKFPNLSKLEIISFSEKFRLSSLPESITETIGDYNVSVVNAYTTKIIVDVPVNSLKFSCLSYEEDIFKEETQTPTKEVLESLTVEDIISHFITFEYFPDRQFQFIDWQFNFNNKADKAKSARK